MKKEYCDVCEKEITFSEMKRGNPHHTCEELRIDGTVCIDCRPDVEAAEEKYLVEQKIRDMVFIKKTFPVNPPRGSDRSATSTMEDFKDRVENSKSRTFVVKQVIPDSIITKIKRWVDKGDV